MSPSVFGVIGSGGVVIDGEGIDEEFVYQTWVLSGSEYKASIYSNYNFNSYCTYQKEHYGANDNGIYKLGKTLDGENTIHPGLTIGPTNLGIFNKKRIRSIYIGDSNEDARVQVSMSSQDAVLEREYSVERGKAAISRDLYGEEITIRISDFDELTMVEVVPVILHARKGR